MALDLPAVLGKIPYRMALAGGWIDQPFVSRCNPVPPGSMVVVSLEPDRYYMERCGMATGTRNLALKLWNGVLPAGDPDRLARELYQAENAGKAEPSGSQDMIGILTPGVSRLDYDFDHEGGIFPVQVESNTDPLVAGWLEQVIHLVPVSQRPAGYAPLGIKNLDREWIRRLGQSGKDCHRAILAMEIQALGASFNECMLCWEAILPHSVRHPIIQIDLLKILHAYQSCYPGAMYSGCGGGYVYVVSEDSVPGSFQVKVKL